MTHHKKQHLIIRFYSKVGAPEITFFISLIALFFIPFIFETEKNIVDPLLWSLYIFSLQYFIHSFQKRYQKALFLLITIILICIWIHFFISIFPSYLFGIFKIILMIISFYFVSYSLLINKSVDFNTLIAGISGYILIGISMGILVFILESASPQSFSFTNENSYDAFYYSFVTMSTLGYGDILPLTKSAKGLSVIITLIGQFYMAIVLGLIIGKMIAPKEKANE